MSCSNCGGYNPDNCIVCRRRPRIRVAVLTASLMLLLTACSSSPPSPAPTTWVQLINGWGFGIFFIAISLVWALESRWKRPKHCKGCHCVQQEDDE